MEQENRIEVIMMKKAINCLALELPESVWEDVNGRWQAVLRLIKSQSNSSIDKLPQEQINYYENKIEILNTISDAQNQALKTANEEISKLRNSIDNGWISIEEALPENSDEVLCYAPYIKDIIGHVLIGKYFPPERGHRESWTVYDFEEARMDIKVTHWQKLPQPPNKK